MDLYSALTATLSKVKENNETCLYSKDYLEILRRVMDNQERLAESILILGTVLTGIVDKNVDIEVFPDKDALKN